MNVDDNTKMVAFADDLTGVVKLTTLTNGWNTLYSIGPKFYFFIFIFIFIS